MITGLNKTDCSDNRLLEVYYDGPCSLCSLEIGIYSSLRGAEKIYFIDASDPNNSIGADLSRTDAMKRFHVSLEDGQLISGAEAFVAIWDRLPSWQFLARLAQAPRFFILLEIFYIIFLPMRPFLFRISKILGARPHSENVR